MTSTPQISVLIFRSVVEMSNSENRRENYKHQPRRSSKQFDIELRKGAFTPSAKWIAAHFLTYSCVIVVGTKLIQLLSCCDFVVDANATVSLSFVVNVSRDEDERHGV